MGTLFIVATPIGNLDDITYRAIDILSSVDVVACEDTRHTKVLLEHYNISKTLISFHQHSQISRIEEIIMMLKSGKNIALVSDAGTPGINDPGGVLVGEAIKRNIDIVPIPGPFTLATLLSVAGIAADKFMFLGFLPKKKGRATLFNQIKIQLEENSLNMPIVIYESAFRIEKTLDDFAKIGNFNVIIGRELTKKFEQIIRGNITKVIAEIKNNKYKIKGEFVVCLNRE